VRVSFAFVLPVCIISGLVSSIYAATVGAPFNPASFSSAGNLIVEPGQTVTFKWDRVTPPWMDLDLPPYGLTLSNGGSESGTAFKVATFDYIEFKPGSTLVIDNTESAFSYALLSKTDLIFNGTVQYINEYVPYPAPSRAYDLSFCSGNALRFFSSVGVSGGNGGFGASNYGGGEGADGGNITFAASTIQLEGNVYTGGGDGGSGGGGGGLSQGNPGGIGGKGGDAGSVSFYANEISIVGTIDVEGGEGATGGTNLDPGNPEEYRKPAASGPKGADGMFQKFAASWSYPNTSDVDADGLTAYEEIVVYRTNPQKSDTDGDGLEDGYEVGIGRFSMISGLLTWAQAKDAAEASGGNLATFTSQEEFNLALLAIGPDALDTVTGAWIGATDANEEGIWLWVTGEPFSFNNWADGQPDNFSNSDVAEVSGGFGAQLGKWFDTGAGVTREGYLLEIGYTTDPTIADSDGDGLTDGQEVLLTFTNPNLKDSDNNGIPDNQEDRDDDGLPDYIEIIVHGTNPDLADTDSDGFDDLFELNTGFDPTLASSTPQAYSQILVAAEFRFNAAAGVSYKIESSTDLENWEIIETGIIGIGARVTRFYSIEATPKRHFRARRE
jgi:hypothetical protein